MSLIRSSLKPACHLKPVCLIPLEGFYWHYQTTSVLLRKGKYLPVTHLSAHSLLLTLCLPANNSSEFQSVSKVSDSSLKHCKIISYSFWPFYPPLSGRAPSRFPSERPLCWATCPLSVNSPFLFNKNCKPASDLLSLFFDTTNVCYFFPFLLVFLFVVLGSSSQTFCALQCCDILADLFLCFICFEKGTNEYYLTQKQRALVVLYILTLYQILIYIS